MARAAPGLLFGAVVAAVTYDTAGYFIGKTLGASPLGGALRAVSPNKTQEGLLGGVVVSILVTFIYLTVTSPGLLGSESFSTRTALFAVLCPLAAPLGDLAESMIKRDLQVKDMGTVLPSTAACSIASTHCCSFCRLRTSSPSPAGKGQSPHDRSSSGRARMINVAVLGSTGSIGTQTLDVIATEPERFRVASLSAHGSVEAVAARRRRSGPTSWC
jgi:hypothetical protein